ncbi:hypothetical protein [Macrococcus armenti]|uniref:hypothetical protein n=1 Tax=Macrococcus armenti TaxID=2875764 RepID=UPI001CCC4019|nr:hypothetical protein [Macrococcus armenti]UBH16590.1 hypothetical protein LAU44_12130 [Macrococcus armenti]UBH21225.1 hypothetical protein LAU40_12165 [Macrococcus armenti]
MNFENDYINALINLQRGNKHRIIWSEILVEVFQNHSFDDVPYYQSQLLDPSTLFEVSKATGIDLKQLEDMTYSTESENIKII